MLGFTDFEVVVPSGRDIVVLHLADPQMIDAEQCRSADALGERQKINWTADKAEEQCFGYIRQTVEATRPDLIVIAGDLVYGRFDDNGSALSSFAEFMGSLGVPWAPVFGNHDNESRMGVDWQCSVLGNAKNCLFKQGTLTGNCNYSVGIVQDGRLKRVFYMLDNNCCTEASEESRVNGHTRLTYNFMPDQLEWLESSIKAIKNYNGDVRFSVVCHLAFNACYVAMEKYGLKIGDVADLMIDSCSNKCDGDFGYIGGKIGHTANIDTDGVLWRKLKELGIDSVLLGHEHSKSSSIIYDGVRIQFGQKSSTYDGFNNLMPDGSIKYEYYEIGKAQVGGTAIVLSEKDGAIRDGYIHLCK